MEAIVKKYNIILVAVMLLLGAGVFYFTKDMPKELHGGLGPGQWPRFVVAILLSFTVLLVFQTIFLKPDSPSPIDFKSKGQKRVFGLFGVVIAFGLVQPIFGFFLSTALFIVAVMLIMGEKSKLRILLSSAGITAFIYVFFSFLLNVMLPRPFFM
jgi:hypothetical protein